MIWKPSRSWERESSGRHFRADRGQGTAGHLDLLHKMWEVVFIPGAVLEEVRPEKAGSAAKQEAMQQGWLKAVTVQAPESLPVWMGAGETECLALARQIVPDVVLDG